MIRNDIGVAASLRLGICLSRRSDPIWHFTDGAVGPAQHEVSLWSIFVFAVFAVCAKAGGAGPAARKTPVIPPWLCQSRG